MIRALRHRRRDFARIVILASMALVFVLKPVVADAALRAAAAERPGAVVLCLGGVVALFAPGADPDEAARLSLDLCPAAAQSVTTPEADPAEIVVRAPAPRRMAAEFVAVVERARAFARRPRAPPMV